MRNCILYLFLFALLGFTGCKKTPLPNEDPGNPVFSFSGNLNGREHISFNAGDDDYYMHSACWPDENHIYIYQGELKPGCCNYGLKVQINDWQVTAPNARPLVDSAVHTGSYLLNNKSLLPTEQVVNFIPVRSLKDNETFSWRIIRGTNNITAVDNYSASAVFALGSTYTVELSYLAGDGSCTTTHTNVFRVGNPFQATVTAVRQQSLTYGFSSATSAPGEYKYLWQFGDGQTSTQPSPVHTYAAEDNYLTKLILINANGDSCISYYQVPAINDGLCQANFNAVFEPLNFDKVLKTITIFFTDKDGLTFSSADAVQPATFSKAEIRSVEEYDRNAGGYPTKKVHLAFTCVLKNGMKTITLENAEAILAVSYRK